MKKIFSWMLYLVLFFIIVMMTGYITFTLLSFSRTVEVPELRGMSLPEANSIVSKRGLYLKVEGEEYDPLIPQGHVTRQDIPPKNKVKESRGIKVFISKGPRALLTPEVTGLTFEEAESVILKYGLKLGRLSHVHSDIMEKGVVIAQRPDPEERPGDNVSLIVSAGPYQKTLICPDLRGKDLKEAVNIADDLGLKLESLGSGQKVISQKPQPNTILKTGDIIYLYLGEY